MASPSFGTALHILVNGEPHSVASPLTVAALLDQLGIRSERVAVEINLQIVDRQSFESRALAEGDRVEVISFIGGGSGVVAGAIEWPGARRTRASGNVLALGKGRVSARLEPGVKRARH